jgi:tRNA dimethylallyltransferase
MKKVEQLALIGSTASGKTSLAIALAQKKDAHILSLDSLALYKEIDIVSAKPTKKERGEIKHFGIDLLYPNEHFDVTMFIACYKEAYRACESEGKNLIIVGGTSFYLKMLLEGVSPMPHISKATKKHLKERLQNLQEAYASLYRVDEAYMSKIKPQDSYRIEKAMELYLETGQTPTTYFQTHPPVPTIQEALPIYQIVWEKEALRQRIALRTNLMVEEGLIDEICYLEKTYTRAPNAMKSIGIKETLAYLDGIYTKKEMIEKITTNTARLAKRQQTFNQSQFNTVTRGSLEDLKKILL